jgi:hypothetical protein
MSDDDREGSYDRWHVWHPRKHPIDLSNAGVHDPIPVPKGPRLRVVPDPEPVDTSSPSLTTYIPDPEPWVPPELPRTHQGAKPAQPDPVQLVRDWARWMRGLLPKDEESEE